MRTWCLALSFAVTSATLASELTVESARRAAVAVGRALTDSRAEALEPILPDQGRVHLALVCMGPEEGMFGAEQVLAVFRDFLARGRVAAFDVASVEADERTGAHATARAAITGRDGRKRTVHLRLGFASEGGRWVLREVKETAE